MSNPSYRPEGVKIWRDEITGDYLADDAKECDIAMRRGRFLTDAELTAMDAAVAAKDAEIERLMDVCEKCHRREALVAENARANAAEQRIRELDEELRKATHATTVVDALKTFDVRALKE